MMSVPGMPPVAPLSNGVDFVAPREQTGSTNSVIYVNVVYMLQPEWLLPGVGITSRRSECNTDC